MTILGLGLCGCMQTTAQRPVRAPEAAVAPAATQPATQPVAEPAQPVAEPAQPVAIAEPRAAEPVALTEPLANPDPAWSLSPADVVLQLEGEATFGAEVVGSPLRPFGRVPEYTQYRDGTVIFPGTIDGRFGVYTYRLDPAAGAAHVEHVLGLGFARIPGHAQECVERPEGKVCGSDAPNVALGVRTANGKLRKIRNYAGWSEHHQPALDAIYEYVEALTATPPADVRLYLPRKATLFVSALTELDDKGVQRLARSPEWPLAPELFDRVYAEKWTSVVIDAAQAQAIVTVSGTNMPRVLRLRHGERGVLVKMVPWLPGVDHTAAMKRARREEAAQRRRDERDAAE